MLSALVAGALLAASTGPALADTRAERGQARLVKALEDREAGAPVNCINQRSIRSSEIIDGSAILYRMDNGKLFLNTPTSGARSLDRDDILVTRTHGSQLCSIDVVRLYDRSANFQSGFVGLGKFVPYTRVRPRP
jgi:hypothetical protein